MTTIDTNKVCSLDDAEEFSLPTVGRHKAHIGTAEMQRTASDVWDMIIVNVKLSHSDPQAPGFPMRSYLLWPNPEDKDTMWGTRTAYGSMMQKIKNLLIAIGGPESGEIKQSKVMALLAKSEGKEVYVKIKAERMKPERLEALGLEKDDPKAMQILIDSFEPA